MKHWLKKANGWERLWVVLSCCGLLFPILILPVLFTKDQAKGRKELVEPELFREISKTKNRVHIVTREEIDREIECRGLQAEGDVTAAMEQDVKPSGNIVLFYDGVGYPSGPIAKKDEASDGFLSFFGATLFSRKIQQ